MTKLEMEHSLDNGLLAGVGNQYIIAWLNNRKKYQVFDLKKMSWSPISGKAQIGRLAGIIPIHASMNVCKVKEEKQNQGG